jgi:hypothetical protein
MINPNNAPMVSHTLDIYLNCVINTMVKRMAFVENSQKPSMTLGQKVVYSVVGGIVFTLISALFPNTGLIGTSGYGYPFPWLAQPFYPSGGPMIFLVSGLILDQLVWTVVAFLVIKIYQVLRKEESATAFADAKP